MAQFRLQSHPAPVSLAQATALLRQTISHRLLLSRLLQTLQLPSFLRLFRLLRSFQPRLLRLGHPPGHPFLCHQPKPNHQQYRKHRPPLRLPRLPSHHQLQSHPLKYLPPSRNRPAYNHRPLRLHQHKHHKARYHHRLRSHHQYKCLLLRMHHLLSLQLFRLRLANPHPSQSQHQSRRHRLKLPVLKFLLPLRVLPWRQLRPKLRHLLENLPLFQTPLPRHHQRHQYHRQAGLRRLFRSHPLRFCLPSHHHWKAQVLRPQSHQWNPPRLRHLLSFRHHLLNSLLLLKSRRLLSQAHPSNQLP